jgi:hypothetical protein
LNSPSHSAQHANVNDAVEAIETALLDGAPLHIDDANERVGVGNVSPSYKLDVTGDINATGDLRIGGNQVGEWIDYSASQTFGGVTVGNGTVVSYYARVKDVVHYTGKFQLGSTSSVSASLDLNLPVASASSIVLHWPAQVVFYDSGTRYIAGTALSISSTVYRCIYWGLSGSILENRDLSATAPFTWTTGDEILWSFTYRAA